MKKKLFLCAMLFAGLTFASVKAQTWTGSDPASTDTCFLYNVGQKAFMIQGGSWGTRAVLSATNAERIVLTSLGSGAYSLHLFDTDNNNHSATATKKFLGTNSYVDSDSPTGGWVATLVDGTTDTYTLVNASTSYFGYDGAQLNVVASPTLSANYYWKFVTLSNVAAALPAATKAAPVDASFYIKAANFYRNNFNYTCWTNYGSKAGGNDTGWAMEKYSTNFDLYQVINVPNGTYKITVNGFYRDGVSGKLDSLRKAGAEVINSYLYANSDSAAMMSILDGVSASQKASNDAAVAGGYVPASLSNAGLYLAAGNYASNKLYVTVTDGKLRIGIKNNSFAASDWTTFNNFHLYYYGDATTAAEVASYEKNLVYQAKIDAVNALLTEAATLSGSTQTEVVDNLAAAVTAGNAAVASPNDEALDAAKVSLTKAIFYYKASLATSENPFDMTSVITTSWLFSQTISGWHNFCTTTNITEGEYTGIFTESWSGSNGTAGKAFYQVLANMPIGSYTLKAACFGNDQSDGVLGDGYYLYCGTAKSAALDVNGKSKYLTAANGMCLDGNLEIGILLDPVPCNWLGFADMKLVYNGYVDPLPAMITTYLESIAAAKALVAAHTYMVGQPTTDLNAAMVDTSALKSYAATLAAYNALNSAITSYKAAEPAFTNLNTIVSGYTSYTGLAAARTAATSLLKADTTTVAQVEAQVPLFYAAVLDYAKANASITNPVDISGCLLTNAALAGSSTGWSGDAPNLGSNCCEYYQKAFQLYQTIATAPQGLYRVTSQAFQRPGWNDAGAAYKAGTEKISAYMYANADTAALSSIYSVTTTESWGSLNGYANSMSDADQAFSASAANYLNSLYTYLPAEGALNIGIGLNSSADGYWTLFRNFKLYYAGTKNIATVNPLKNPSGLFTLASPYSDSVYVSAKGLVAGSKTTLTLDTLESTVDSSKVFYLVPTATSYKIKTLSGRYLTTSHNWNAGVSVNAADAGDFTIEDQGYGLYSLKEVRGYVGVNANENPGAVGTSLYTNKAAGAGYIKFGFISAGEDAARVLASAIEVSNAYLAQAQTLKTTLEGNGTIGKGVFMVDSTSYQALANAISSYVVPTTIEECVAADKALAAAMATAKTLNTPDPTTVYTINNLTYPGYILDVTTSGVSNVKIAVPTNGLGQRFNFISSAKGYYIKSLNGNYVTMNANNAWTMNARPEATNAEFVIENRGNGVYALKNLYNNKYLGSDADHTVYGDKAVTYNSWSISAFVAKPAMDNVKAATVEITASVYPSDGEHAVKVVVLSPALAQQLSAASLSDESILTDCGDSTSFYTAAGSITLTKSSDYSGLGLSEAIAPEKSYVVLAGQFGISDGKYVSGSLVKDTVTTAYATLPLQVTTAQGLPGTTVGTQMTWKSPIYQFKKAVKSLRFTLNNNNTGDTDGSGNFHCFAFSEFYVFTAAGDTVPLTSAAFTTNAQEPSEGPIANISDGNTAGTNYFHTAWSSELTETPYIEVQLPDAMYSLSFGYISRNLRCIPVDMTVSEAVTPVEKIEKSVSVYAKADYSADEIDLTSELTAKLGTLSSISLVYAYGDELMPDSSYTANSGFWYTNEGKRCSWGNTGCSYFIEPNATTGILNLGQFPGALKAGDSSTLQVGVKQGDTTVLVQLNIAIVAVPGFSPVKTDTITVTAFAPAVDTGYALTAVPLASQLSALGVTDLTQTKLYGIQADTLTAGYTGNGGFWSDAKGAICKWGATGCAFDYEYNKSTGDLNFFQFPGGNKAGDLFKAVAAIGYENGDSDQLVVLNIRFLTGYPKEEGTSYLRDVDSWLNSGTVNSGIDSTAVAGLWSYEMSASGISFNVQIDPTVTANYWGSTGFYLDPEKVEIVLGVAPSVAAGDMKVFFPLSAAGDSLTAWSSYAPGEWYSATGDAAAWNTGAAYWYYQVKAGQYYDFNNASGVMTGYMLFGHNPGNITKDTEFTQKSIYNGKQWNVTIKYVDGLGVSPKTLTGDVEGNVKSRSYYSVSGAALDAPVKGINVVRTVYSDGSVKVQKIWVK